MKTHRNINQVCPFCHKAMDSASSVDRNENPPEKGDVVLCMVCGEWSIFNPDVPNLLSKPTNEDYDEIVASPLCNKVRLAWLLLKTSK